MKSNQNDVYIKPEIANDEAIDWQGARSVANMNGALLQYANVWEYAKDFSGRYWGADKRYAALAGMSDARDLVEMHEHDLPWTEYSHNYLEQDKALVDVKRFLILDKICDYKGKEKIVLSSKSLVQDYKGKAVGVMGISVDLSSLDQAQLAWCFNQVLKLEQQAQQIKREFVFNGSTVVLAKREAEVLHYLARGKTAKEAGRILNLSNRTVESYLSNARNKIGCVNKAQLVDLYWQG